MSEFHSRSASMVSMTCSAKHDGQQRQR